MSNDTFSPVSEVEMRNFFDRFATSFVSLSQQATQLADLQSRFNDLDARVASLVGDNERLRNQVQTLVAERDAARVDAQEAWKIAEEEGTAKDNALRRVHELEGQLQSSRERIDRLDADCNRAWSKVADTERTNIELTESLARAERNAKEGWNAFEAANEKANALASRLAKVRASFDDFDAIGEPPNPSSF